MFQNYFKIAWRNLLKHRQFTLLNLLGLSTGLACALLIYLWVYDELHIDKFNEKDSRLYQVMKNSPNADGTTDTHTTTPCLLADALVKEIPEIEYALPVVAMDEYGENKGILSAGNKLVKARPQFAGKDYFNVFSYRFIQGDKRQAFNNRYGVLLSDKLALKLFNTTENVVGRTVSWNQGDALTGTYIVTGIVEAPPVNASLPFDCIFSFDLYYDTFKDRNGLASWDSNNPSTFVVVKEGTNIQQLNDKIREFSRIKYNKPRETKGMNWYGAMFLQRFSERHLYNHYENGEIAGGRIEYVRLFSVIAIFILIIACINFMNLSTAKAAGRLKEVGIKKVAGAGQGTLMIQYLGESILMSFLSLMIAFLLINLLLPSFNSITGKQLQIYYNSHLILTVSGITLLTGIIAGSYPAFYLSRFKPVAVLKGQLKNAVGELWIRKGLVVFQFALSAIFIVSVLVVYKQMQLIQTKNLGYNKDNVIYFASEGKLRNGIAPFLDEVKKIPGVVNASAMSGNFTGLHSGGSGIDWEGTQHPVEFSGVDADYDLFETLELHLAEGRSFSKRFGADSNSVLFNEAAIAAMGLKNPVGKMVTMWGRKKLIIGVVKNFHFESLYKNVGPFFIRYSNENDNVIIKIKAGEQKATIDRVGKFYKRYNMGLPFEYKFLDEDYEKLYAAEERVAVLSKYFAGLAIIISCLGLFGLAAFTAQKRQKEIGIRKVIGASVQQIMLMLSKDFLKLILVAVIIAFPAAWWILSQWLHNFAYRIHIGAGLFLIAGVAMLLITVITISFQAIKAAIANPVAALRSE